MLSKKKLNIILTKFFLLLFWTLFFLNFFRKTVFATNITNFWIIIYWIIIITIVFWSLVFYLNRNNVELDNYDLKSNKNFIIIFLLICLIWIFNIFTNLWKLPFHQDEQFHFSPAYTYSQTWEFAKWDFLYNQKWDSKWTDRNKSLTVLSSYSQNIFWMSEFSSRLPVAFVWLIWLFFIYFVTYKTTSNRLIWLISMYLYSVNDVILYFSRFLRWYIFLAIIWLAIFYLIYKFLNENKTKLRLKYLWLSILLLLVWFEFHATIILVWPLIMLCVFLFINSIYSIKKHYYIYMFLFLIFLILILNILWIVHWFKLPYNIANHISLNIDFSKWKTVYLDHLTNAFNYWYFIIFILPVIFFYNYKNNYKLYLLFFFSVYLPLIFSIYFFNRYEDFRYIFILQTFFIILISYFIYHFRNIFFRWKIYILLLIIILSIPFQFPYFPEFKPITKKSFANFENVEWNRIHFRSAVPDNHKAFDYIFNKNINKNITIVRLSDWWINWEDNYYLRQYLNKYPENKVIFYKNNLDKSLNFNELYNYNKKTRDQLDKDIKFFDILKSNTNIYVIANTRDLVSSEILNYIDTKCENISDIVWTVKYRIFIYAHPENSHFPNVYNCR